MIDGSKILVDLQKNYKASVVSKTRVDSSIRGWVKAYNGDKYGNEVKGRSQIVMKDVKKAIKSMSPSIIEPFLTTASIVNAKATKIGNEQKADYVSDILNYQYQNEFDRLEFITSISTILPKEGTVFIRTGWAYEEKQEVKTLSKLDMDDIDAMKKQGVKGISKIEDNKDGTFNVTMKRTIIKKNCPTAVICKNESITTDPTASSFSDSKFITYEFEMSLSDLKKQKDIYDYQDINSSLIDTVVSASLYPDTALGGQRATDNYNSGVDYNFNFAEKTSKKIKLVEYWGEYDIDGSGINEQIVCVWIKGTDKILRLDKNPYPDGEIPFVSCQYNFEPFTIWGDGVADVIGDGQQIHTAIMRGFIDNMSLANNGQKLIQKGAIDYVNLAKLQRGEKYIEVNNIEGVRDGTYNNLPPSAFNIYNMITDENERLSGVTKSIDSLDSATIGRSASGMSMATNTAQRHMVILVQVIADMYKDMFNKWASYNMAYLDDKQAMEISGTLVPVDKNQLTDDIRIEIQVQLDSQNQQKIQQINMMLQQAHMYQQQMPPQVVPLLMGEFFDALGKYEEAEQIRQYQPQPDPMQQQMAQLQMQKLQAEIALLNSEAGLSQSKAGEAQAKMTKHQAETDNIDTKTMAIPQDIALKNQEFGHNVKNDLINNMIKSQKTGGN
jgi:hypothetical protein